MIRFRGKNYMHYQRVICGHGTDAQSPPNRRRQMSMLYNQESLIIRNLRLRLRNVEQTGSTLYGTCLGCNRAEVWEPTTSPHSSPLPDRGKTLVRPQ